MRPMQRRAATAGACVLAIALCIELTGAGGSRRPVFHIGTPAVAEQAARPSAQPSGGEELLVQLRPRATVGVMAAALSRVKALPTETVVKEEQQIEGRGELLLVRVEPGVSTSDAKAQLEQLGAVAFVEPNYRYKHQQQSNDAHYLDGKLWGMFGDDKPTAIGPIGPNPPGSLTTNPFGIQAEKAWSAGHTGRADIVVAVLDEGIDVSHPDLKDNIWTNPGESGQDSTGADKATNGKDDDGNGKIDDIHGWDFRGNDNTVFDGTPQLDVDSHGTHVAGTIGGKGGNSIGIAGVVWNVRIIPAKFLGPEDGSTADAIKAIDYLIDLKKRHNLNLVAINNSWGGGPKSILLHDAFKRAAKAGILSVCAAGNGGFDQIGDDNDATPFYPASYDTTADWTADGGTAGESFDAIVAVASLSRDGSLAGSSNFGKQSVDLAAPGDPVLSTLPRGEYGDKSGTSMATPHVTGAVALFVSTHPRATPVQVRTAILEAAKNTQTPSVKDRSVSGGRLNVAGF